MGTVAAAVVAGVMAWAAGSKLARPAATAAGFATLGVPAAGLAARAVPFGELALAVGLLMVPGPAGLVACGLLGGFTVVLVRARRAGTGCACFGQARPRPVRVSDLARNLALMALAAIATIWA
ncbi:MAG: MauE/DoxX family redox-associated membrane protein [Acidimicrobiales bacterium]